MNAVPSAPLSDTKTRILNAAEKLFGQNGFAATSLRDITAEAQANLAAVNYHFQSKDSLIDAVIERRLGPVNQRRLELLEMAGAQPNLEQVLVAFLAPMMDLDVVSGIPLMGRILSSPDLFLERVYKRHLATIATRFADALQRILPDLPAEERFWRLQFMAGSISHVLALAKVLPHMRGEPDVPLDQSALLARLVTFLAAGFRAPAGTTEMN
jgi:AcrR family transcriptional regulator